MLFQFFVQHAHLQHVVDAGFHLDQVKWFTDEVFGTSLQGPKLVRRLGRQNNNGKVIVNRIGLEPFHDLEAIHDRHLQI